MSPGLAHRPSIHLGELTEISSNGRAAGRIQCDPSLVPAPGQYLLAQALQDSDAPLPTPLFKAASYSGGFLLAPPLPPHWLPGTQLHIRGPLGKGFQIPAAARYVALAAFGETTARLLALIEPALLQNAALVLLTDHPPQDLPAAVEISPLSALSETLAWADYLALDTPRTMLPTLTQTIRSAAYSRAGQVFVETPLPCGGMAECGVCAVSVQKGYKLACKDGPVFDLKTVLSLR